MSKVIRNRYALRDAMKAAEEKLNKNIESICKARNIPMKTLAEQTGFKTSTWTNRRKSPGNYGFTELLKIAHYLEVPPESLIFGNWETIDIKTNTITDVKNNYIA